MKKTKNKPRVNRKKQLRNLGLSAGALGFTTGVLVAPFIYKKPIVRAITRSLKERYRVLPRRFPSRRVRVKREGNVYTPNSWRTPSHWRVPGL